MSDEIAFVVPGRLTQLTGGYLFARHIVEGLRARGRVVRVVDGLALANLGQAVTAQAHRLRLIAFVHGPLAQETDLSPAAARRAILSEAGLLSRVRGVICPSRYTAAAIEDYGVSPGRIAVVPPGTARPHRPPIVRRGPVRALLCVANLVPRKGHAVLVEALAR